MSNESDYPQRRADDRAALGLVYTLTERVSTIIQRFDDYADRQERDQEKVRLKLVEHEEMVIRALTSWKWFALIVTTISTVITGLTVWSYSEFSEIRDSVIAHHVFSNEYVKKQEEINHTVEQQIRMLLGGNRNEH